MRSRCYLRVADVVTAALSTDENALALAGSMRPANFKYSLIAGSDDGREIVLALEALRVQGRLQRDPAEGRYSLIG